ncbi:MAG TPA: ergothioneine biosynthesis protein EgtB [Mycobacteriales bacterium]|jgi:ergothioneine biosynthesis protein EgtB|nr:ergothioneine biosynthesis protein EgtB [Mycobacteriales bacterium]
MVLTASPTTLLDAFREVRSVTERLSAPLSAEDQTAQSMPDASPTKWHRGHTTWFFEEFVLGADPGYRAFDPTYRYLFNSYYEAIGARHPRPHRGLVTRPGAAQIGHYRNAVDEAMQDRLAAGSLTESELALTELGCHHEQQHQELILMDAKHLLSMNSLDPVYVDRPLDPDVSMPPLTWRAVAGGLVEIGHDGDAFAFDNEGPAHAHHLLPFEIAERAVTNSDWLEFIADGGYERAEFWLSDGWARIQQEGWTSPAYWRWDDGAWTTFTLSGRRPLRFAEPVCHVSFYEADAFAHWASTRWPGARLPTEQEWEAAARGVGDSVSRLMDPARCHPGVAGTAMIGDVWEWTASAYLPYPGFRPAEGAVGEYNGKFMSDQHVLRGASAATPPGHERLTYRNFFPAGSRWAFSGLRLARS